ncbi:MAG: hypothetical protein HXS50_02595 [Theionarchaea archaeon]|nr:hypothetical protein [Theionarchaea archaeon]
METRILLIISLVMLLTSPVACSGVEGLDSHRISGMVMGHAGFVLHDPFRTLFIRDPLFTYKLYPLPPDLSDSDKRKLDRVYYPRTRQMLVDNYDVIVFHDARFQHFIPKQIHDLDYAFREAQLTGIWVFMGSFLWDWVLDISILREVVPINHHENARYFGFQVRFDRDRDPVFTPFLEYGIEKVLGNAVAEMTARQGSTVWGEIVPLNQPWMVSWKPGGADPGMQWVLIQWYLEGWWNEENNPYALDVATNMLLYSAGREMIIDIQARREARHMFTSLQTQKSIVISMMEWADAFGANIQPLALSLRGLEDQIQSTYADYFEQDYAKTISFLSSMSGTVIEISNEAIRLKDQALLWVYVIEWLSVTGIGLLSGLVAWTLMIRRRLYRQVGATRLRPHDLE